MRRDLSRRWAAARCALPLSVALALTLGAGAGGAAAAAQRGTAGQVSAGERALAAVLAERFPRAGLGPGGVGQVIDAASGRVLWSSGPGTGRMPASTAKLATAVAALTVLGPERTESTSTRYRAEDGTLYLVAGGDPELDPDGLGALAADTAKALKARGVTQVHLSLDDTLFPAPSRPPGWPPGYYPYVVAPVRALSLVGDRTEDTAQTAARLFQRQLAGDGVRSVAGGPSSGTPAPPTPAPPIPAPPTSTGPSGPTGPSDPTDPGAPPVEEGDAAAGRSGALRSAASYATATRTATTAAAATAAPAIGRAAVPREAEPLAVHTSRPLWSTVEYMLKVSDNEIAEELLRLTALATGRPATWYDGTAAVTRVLAGYHVPLDGVALYDGSGLSRRDRLTARALSALAALTVAPAYRSLLWPVYAGMPVAGRDGTLSSDLHRFSTRPSSCAAGLVRAKTGTLHDATALAGVTRDRNGRWLAFAFLENGSTPVHTARHGLDGLAATVEGCW